MLEELFEEYTKMDLIMEIYFLHVILLVIFTYVLSELISRLIINQKKKKDILEIIKNKKIDINTYICNTEDYNEYIFESRELDYKYILSEKEYNKLAKYFKDIKE